MWERLLSDEKGIKRKIRHRIRRTKRKKALVETLRLAILGEDGNGFANGNGKKKNAKGRAGGGGPGGFLVCE